ncbi:MAG: AbrB/MazE/SpoVT family DNA-binding domain-containing protein [Deltaproteobacteria bacterium]|nr:AbrB/MazE/SpoVT family DNA-binding domain-containing protein [Deltaproteobacteria bacterium]
MLIALDKRGSINLPSTIRKELGLESGTYLDLQVMDGGAMLLQPIAIYQGIRLGKQGLQKLAEARQSGTTSIPTWLTKEMKHAEVDPEPEIS